MIELELAINKDVNKEYIDAIKYYENTLKQTYLSPIEVYINLAFLYWKFASGQVKSNDHSKNYSNISGERYPEIIRLGLKQYPKSLELHFWEKYLPHRHYFEEFSQHECEEMIQKYGDKESLVPYFYLYLFDENKYLKKKEKLQKICKELLVAKNRYILSFN